MEALFMEWIVKSLAEDGTALIVIPDGILSNLANKKLREFILDKCSIEGIISLPINTFFGTPKKTYILAIKKKYTDRITSRLFGEYHILQFVGTDVRAQKLRG